MVLAVPPVQGSCAAASNANATASSAWTASCSGHGTLVASPVDGTPLCKCDAMFSGGADMFDLRVLTLPDGTTLSLDCSVSMVAQSLFWAIVAALALLRYVQVAKTLISTCKSRGLASNSEVAKRTNSKQRIVAAAPGGVADNEPTPVSKQRVHLSTAARTLMTHLTYRVLLAELLVICPLFLVTTLLKAVRGDVVGTDVAVTVCFILTVIFFQIAQLDVGLAEFRILFATFSPTVRDRLRRAHLAASLGSLTFYALATGVPTFVALSLPKTQGPICSYQYVLLLVRNVGVVAWQGFSIATTLMLRSRASALMQSSVPVAGGHVSVSSRNNPAQSASRVQKVLEHLNAELGRMRTQGTLSLVLYAVFCIPVLWEQQTFVYAFTWMLAAPRHVGKHISTSSAAMDGGADDTPAHQEGGGSPVAPGLVGNNNGSSPRASSPLSSRSNNTTTTNTNAGRNGGGGGGTDASVANASSMMVTSTTGA